MKIALGTAQFGMDYGISNINGEVSSEEIKKILQYCSGCGVDMIDTAQAYAKAEVKLGMHDLTNFKIVTKITETALIEYSLDNLQVSSVYGILFHREDEICLENWNKLEKFKEKGMVRKIGGSFYSPQKLSDAIENYPIDIVQIPVNVFDQRFLEVLPKLKKKNIEVHIRSIFLQGLLLMDKKDIPLDFACVLGLIDKIPEPRIAYLLNAWKNNEYIDRMVVGVSSIKELMDIVKLYEYRCDDWDFSSMAVHEEKIINPSLWRNLR